MSVVQEARSYNKMAPASIQAVQHTMPAEAQRQWLSPGLPTLPPMSGGVPYAQVCFMQSEMVC
jgi:hypothetical protein